MIVSAEEFIRLRESQHPRLYRRAARDTANDEVWRDILDRYPDMSRWVAHNKTISPGIMAILANHDDILVRMTIAAKRGCPAEQLSVLAEDVNPAVRLLVAYHAKAPATILQKPLEDPWEGIKTAARGRLRKRA